MTQILDFKKNQRIVVISAHADDFELGCGATIAKLVEANFCVESIVLSLRDKTVPKDFPKDALLSETIRAGEEIGLNMSNIHVLDYENRIFPQLRQEILDTLVKFNKEFKPTMAFIPSFDDMHQDHMTVAHEAFRAFKYCNLFSYELPWNRIVTTTNCYSVIESSHVEKKIEALNCYQSQKETRDFFKPEYTRSLALTQGTQIKTRYAEAFEVIRLFF